MVSSWYDNNQNDTHEDEDDERDNGRAGGWRSSWQRGRGSSPQPPPPSRSGGPKRTSSMSAHKFSNSDYNGVNDDEEVETLRFLARSNRRTIRRLSMAVLVLTITAVVAVIGTAVMGFFYLRNRFSSRDENTGREGNAIVSATPVPTSTTRLTATSPPATSAPTPPSVESSIAPTPAPTTAAESGVIEWIQSQSPATQLDDPSSPARRAMDWMSSDSYSLILLSESNNNVFNDRQSNRWLQRFALTTFYYATMVPDRPELPLTTNQEASSSWIQPVDHCQWGQLSVTADGASSSSTSSSSIACDEDGYVTRLHFAGGDGGDLLLIGTLPLELGLLSSHLTFLSCWANELISSTIPTQLGLLTALTYLDLNNNALDGSIPTELARLSSTLQVMNLSLNQLTGSIPFELFSDMTVLTWLALERNALTGTIPKITASSSFQVSSSLGVLSLNRNELTGSIPTELGRYTSLRGLSLDHNNLSGSFPSSLPSLTNLKYFSLHENSQITGTVPLELCNIVSPRIDCNDVNDGGTSGLLQCTCCLCG